MGLAALVVLIVVAAFTGRTIRNPYGDGDLFWQKHLGQYVVTHHALPVTLDQTTFTAAGAPWTPQEWLLGSAAYLTIPSGHLWVLAVLAAAALAVALLVTALRARRAGASALSIAVVTVLLAVDFGGSYGIRAQVFAWPLFALLLLALDASGPAIFWSLAVVAVWANVHASAMLAIPIAWIDALVAWLRAERGQALRRTAVAIAVPAAILATPLGIRLPLYALMLVRSPIRRSIDEWQPVTFSHHHEFFWIGAAPLVLLAAVCIRTLWKERPRDVLYSVLLLIMAIAAVRNAALLGIVVAPLAARAIDLLLARFSWWPIDLLRDAGLRRLAAAATLFAAGVVYVVSVRSPNPPDAWIAPVTTFDRLARLPGERRVFCYDFSVCSIALDHPNLLVFMDGRADPYPPSVWNDFNTIRFTKSGWSQRLDAYRVDTVVAKADDALDRALKTRRDWIALPQADRCCRAYARQPL